MYKIILCTIVLMIFTGCEKELVKKPKRLIEREKMVNIMYDLSLLEAMKVEQNTIMDSVKYTTNQYIYKKYKIDSVQFSQSNIYYAADYKEYEKMYNQIKVRLENEKKQVEVLIKNKTKRELLKAKAKKKLKEKKVKDSIRNEKRKQRIKKQVDSIKASKKIKIN
jgi:hypothetical protein